MCRIFRARTVYFPIGSCHAKALLLRGNFQCLASRGGGRAVHTTWTSSSAVAPCHDTYLHHPDQQYFADVGPDPYIANIMTRLSVMAFFGSAQWRTKPPLNQEEAKLAGSVDHDQRTGCGRLGIAACPVAVMTLLMLTYRVGVSEIWTSPQLFAGPYRLPVRHQAG